MAESLKLRTLARCQLLIGRYPAFRYDARGGGGPGHSSTNADGRSSLQFPADQLSIPPLDWRSTRFLGVPLPPGLQIAIVPEQLEGHWDPASGSIALDFRARFRFSIGIGIGIGKDTAAQHHRIYAAPDLAIHCCLSSGQVTGVRHRGCGRPLNAAGEALLVGVARVAPSGDAWLDRFLGLPDDALAVLQCQLERAAPADCITTP